MSTYSNDFGTTAPGSAAGTPGTTPGTMTGTAGTSSSTTDKAKDAASTATDQGKHLAGTTKDEALDVAATAAEQARTVIGDARQQVTTQVNDQATTGRDKLSQTLRSFGDDLQQMVEQGPDQGMAVDLAREVSDRARALGSHLEGREPGDLLEDARDFARRRPGTFLLGALAAGVVAGRLFRATADGAAAASLDEPATGYGAAGPDSGVGTPTGTSYDTGYGTTGVGAGPLEPMVATPSSLDPTQSGLPGQRTQDTL